jgi:hypothetical protein
MTQRKVGLKSTEFVALNGRFHDASLNAAQNFLQMRGNAASAIAARASGRFVRIVRVSEQRSEGS